MTEYHEYPVILIKLDFYHFQWRTNRLHNFTKSNLLISTNIKPLFKRTTCPLPHQSTDTASTIQKTQLPRFHYGLG